MKDARHYNGKAIKDAIVTATCTAAVILSFLGCASDRPDHNTPSPKAAATVSVTDSVLSTIKDSLIKASSDVQDAVSPHAEELHVRTKEEIEKLLTWEYFVLDMPPQVGASELQRRLSSLGLDRWECFSVQHVSDGTQITCKRRPKSALAYLKCLSGL